jgi:beta-fructofuranosidase
VSTDAGQWSAALPQKVNAGETLKLHVFLDGSIVDIFVNDRWAFSVRLFPTDANAVEVEAFANASTAAKINAWVLDASRDADGIRPVTGGGVGQYNPAVYNLLGRRIAQSGTCISSQRGIYIQDGRKIVR